MHIRMLNVNCEPQIREDMGETVQFLRGDDPATIQTVIDRRTGMDNGFAGYFRAWLRIPESRPASVLVFD